MPFALTIPQQSGTTLSFTIDAGETLFVLGANGTGKSNLMQRFSSLHSGSAHRISAHRQTWLSSGALDITPAGRSNVAQNIANFDMEPTSRWKDNYSERRPAVALYDLIEAENARARSITAAVDSADFDLAKKLSKEEAPIKVINELYRLSNIPIQISADQNGQILASKSGSPPYSVAELSDGERNALFIAADILTLKAGTLVLIDEPERHLHRSIISPLLTLLFERRQDCAFVVSTHEVMLPLDNPTARTLLVRNCIYSDTLVRWDADLIEPGVDIGDELRKDILGARRRILFVEGAEQSLDKPLYSLVFPNVSIIPKASSRDVESVVAGIRASTTLHWVSAFGLVDNDRRTQEDIDRMKGNGVYALPVFSVESIYYHPEVQRRVVERHATVTGADPSTLLTEANAVALEAIKAKTQHLSERSVEHTIREEIFRQRPGRPEIRAKTPINISIDVSQRVDAERDRLQGLIEAGDLWEIISKYPVRETSALSDISRKLGFQNRDQYENAVLKLLVDDEETLTFVRSLFGTLPTDLNAV